MEWKHPGSPTKKKFKTQSSAGKLMLTVFWDSKGPIREDYLEKGCKLQCFAGQQSEASNSHQTPRREAVHKWLRDQPKSFFVEGIRKLVYRWTKCIEKEGDYVEK
jgi:hypothetical protein